MKLKISVIKYYFQLILCIFCYVRYLSAEALHGFTIRNWPYANQLENGQFEGFVVDILNEVARLAHLTYTLKLSNETDYGGWSINGSITGVIGQIYHNEADFAIGDITRLRTRDRYVEFSHPFLKFGLSALIRKDLVGSMSSFKDLADQSFVDYGVKKLGANLPLFHSSPVITKMYNYMDANPSTFVSGEKEGIQRTKTSRYAFITESTFNEYIAQRECDLTVIDDRRQNFQFEYAIAMRRGLSQRNAINDAIREMQKSGKLEALKEKYWKSDKCVEKTNVVEVNPKVVSARLEDHEREEHETSDENSNREEGKVDEHHGKGGRHHRHHHRHGDHPHWFDFGRAHTAHVHYAALAIAIIIVILNSFHH